MTEFTFTVFETRVVEMRYTVDAKSEAEAREKAESGETTEETFVRDLSVNNREIYDD